MFDRSLQNVTATFSKPQILLPLAILAATLVGVVVPYELYQKVLIALLVVVVGIVTFFLQAHYQVLGLAVLVVTAVLLPIEIGDSAQRAIANSSLPLAAFVSGTWILRAIAVRQSGVVESSPVVWASVLFVFTSAVSFVVGQTPWFGIAGAPLRAQIGAFGMIMASIGLFLMVGHQVRKIRHLRWLTWLFLGTGAIICTIQLSPSLDSLASFLTRPSTIGSAFWTWLVAMSLSQALINRSLRSEVRMALALLTALALFRGLVQNSSWVSGWLPALVAAAVVLILCRPRLSLFVACGAMPFLLVLAYQALMFVRDSEQYSLMTRLEAWRVLADVVSKSPLIGLGPANYYHYTELVPTLGWYVKFSSHNNYVDIVAQTGLFGFAAFLWLAFEMFRLNWRLHALASSSDFAAAYAVGALAGLVGTLVSGMLGDWMIPFVYNTGIPAFRSSLFFWLFLGGVLALKRMLPLQHPGGVDAGRPRVLATPAVNQ
jgi:hypothetical protein